MISIANVLLACALPSLASAIPLVPRQSSNSTSTNSTAPSDTQVLQFALTLEHLEAAFYQQYLTQFSASDFQSAGYEDWVRGRFEQISEHETTHVEFLSTALGNESVAACNYSFPVTDVHSFVSVSQMLEAVGAAAYTGAAQYLSTPAYVEAAASILTVEANHGAWIQSAAQKENPWSSAFGNSLGPSEAYTLASAFVTSCPSSNPKLPVQAFPALTLVGNVTLGSQATFEFNASLPSGSQSPYLALISGLSTTIVPLTISNSSEFSNKTLQATADIPGSLQGTVFAIVTSDNTTVTDSNTFAGPALLNFFFGSDVDNSQ